MTTYLLCLDISYYLLSFLPVSDIIHLMQINSYFYQLILGSKTFEGLNLLKNKKHKLKACYKYGLIDILTQLRKHHNHYLHPKGLIYAAANGNIRLLNWFLKGDLTTACLLKANYYAIIHGQIAVLDWFHRNHYPCMNIEDFVISDCLDDCEANCASHDQYLFTHIEHSKKIMILEWFEKWKTVHYGAINCLASDSGQLNVIQWLYCRYLSTDDLNYTLTEAIRRNYLDILQWLRLKTNLPISAVYCEPTS